MTKLCEHCGTDITHHESDKIRFCQQSDGRNGCYSGRQTAIHQKWAKNKVVQAGRKCVVCGKIVNSPKATTCSYSCSARLRHRKANKHYRTSIMSGHLEWPYKLPADQAVTPSMMDPMG